MNKGIIIGITILFLGVAVAPLTQGIITKESNPPISDGNTLYVGGYGPNNYSMIQDGIDAANAGDTVFVYDDSSPYYENVVVNKTINLIGENKDTTVIDGNYSRHTIHVSADSVYIRGFTIRKGYTDGIFLVSSYSTIEGNNINSNKQSGINLWLSYWVYKNNITGNIISNNWHGILIHGSSNNITGNIISNNIGGISLGSYNNTITYNSILKNLIGIAVQNEVNNTILKNNILNNLIGAFFEIFLNGEENFTIKWEQNYWNRPRLLPKPIFGIKFTQNRIYPGVMFDTNPAKEPYDING